jgi:hypothetical protein
MENNKNKNKKNWTNIKIKEWKWYLGRPMIRSQLNAGPYATLRAWYRKKPAHFAYPRPGVWAAHVLTRPRCVLAAAPRPRLGLPWSPYHRRRRLNPAPRASHPRFTRVAAIAGPVLPRRGIEILQSPPRPQVSGEVFLIQRLVLNPPDLHLDRIGRSTPVSPPIACTGISVFQQVLS